MGGKYTGPLFTSDAEANDREHRDHARLATRIDDAAIADYLKGWMLWVNRAPEPSDTVLDVHLRTGWRAADHMNRTTALAPTEYYGELAARAYGKR